MWIWDQSLGALYWEGDDLVRTLICKGYSGRDWGKNNPSAQTAKGIGPIPCGWWKIGKLYNSFRVGKNAIVLEPHDVPNLAGRSAFRIHGDSIRRPGTASHGCIILPLEVRLRIHRSQVKILLVVE